ncbi:response regulator transcription factor [uncultured Holdemanella sp.]|uniref:response regulator transcription factor n=1 Tax=uncultured Holdemanella sp. TaxID=1763549 RepID=UPI0025E6D003|nr:response regulator transcription factor [uncultured Holdemanella sp.]
MVKIMIADDQQLIRESLKIILDSDPDFEVVKVVGSGQEVLESLKTESIDIILMDVRMPNMSGVDCTRIVKKEYPNIKVIILTTFDDDEYIYDALKYGASGYLLKGCSLEELSTAIHNVLSGGACFNPNVAGKVAQFFSQMANSHTEVSFDGEEKEYDFSDTEQKIIAQIGHGYSNKEIAQKLGFSEGTIRNYLSVILDKLELRDRTQLAIWYLSRGNK